MDQPTRRKADVNIQTLLTSTYTVIGILVIIFGAIWKTSAAVAQMQQRIDEDHSLVTTVYSIDQRLSRIEGAIGIKQQQGK